ncbi:MAG: 30S ribosomal protein S7 [Bacteroidia bacterium]|nr:30S ribosomal protein S7 [Bacteroidia bacterium]MDW8159608.1 30S ribosomal protein S7 [Bacteroidia bacterium]
MRNRKAPERDILPDPKYNSKLVAGFVNQLMRRGKKSKAYMIFYKALDIIEKKTNQNSLEVFEAALNNVMPHVEVRSRRVGGATFQIPTEVRPKRKISKGMKWLIMFSKKRGEKTMSERLAAEIIAASKNEGAAVKKKEDTHRMAEANKAFSHFRF